MCKTDSPTYKSWASMIARCKYEKSNSYHNYGGRGISVCERWRSFENFLADMGERPEGMTLDRKDPNKDYSPGNCRWASQTIQSVNKRGSTRAVVAYKGVDFKKSHGLYRARIQDKRGMERHIGYFRTAEDAAKAYDREAFKAWGEYAYLNFPEMSSREEVA